MSTYKTWAYDVFYNEETILCIDHLCLLLVYSPVYFKYPKDD